MNFEIIVYGKNITHLSERKLRLRTPRTVQSDKEILTLWLFIEHESFEKIIQDYFEKAKNKMCLEEREK